MSDLEPAHVELPAGVYLPHRPVVVVFFLGLCFFLVLVVVVVGGGVPAVAGDGPRGLGQRLRLLNDPHDLLHALRRVGCWCHGIGIAIAIGIAAAGGGVSHSPAAVVGCLCLLLELPGQVFEVPWVALDLAHGDPLVGVLDEDAGEEVAAVVGDVHVLGDLVLHGHDALPEKKKRSKFPFRRKEHLQLQKIKRKE